MGSFFGFRIGVFWGLGFVVFPRPDWFVAKSRHEIFELAGLRVYGPCKASRSFRKVPRLFGMAGEFGRGSVLHPEVFPLHALLICNTIAALSS